MPKFGQRTRFSHEITLRFLGGLEGKKPKPENLNNFDFFMTLQSIRMTAVDFQTQLQFRDAFCTFVNFMPISVTTTLEEGKILENFSFFFSRNFF
jgi:hypothetical protein